MMGTAFVTGGSGFIGGHLIERLVRDGWVVRALARSNGSAARVAELGAEPARGDLDSPEAIRLGAEGADIAFHAACPAPLRARSPGSSRPSGACSA